MSYFKQPHTRIHTHTPLYLFSFLYFPQLRAIYITVERCRSAPAPALLPPCFPALCLCSGTITVHTLKEYRERCGRWPQRPLEGFLGGRTGPFPEGHDEAHCVSRWGQKPTGGAGDVRATARSVASDAQGTSEGLLWEPFPPGGLRGCYTHR